MLNVGYSVLKIKEWLCGCNTRLIYQILWLIFPWKSGQCGHHYTTWLRPCVVISEESSECGTRLLETKGRREQEEVCLNSASGLGSSSVPSSRPLTPWVEREKERRNTRRAHEEGEEKQEGAQRNDHGSNHDASAWDRVREPRTPTAAEQSPEHADAQ